MRNIEIDEYDDLDMYVGKVVGIYGTNREFSENDWVSNLKVIFIGVLEKLFDRKSKLMRGYTIKQARKYDLDGTEWRQNSDRYVTAVTRDDFEFRKPSFILEDL